MQNEPHFITKHMIMTSNVEILLPEITVRNIPPRHGVFLYWITQLTSQKLMFFSGLQHWSVIIHTRNQQ